MAEDIKVILNDGEIKVTVDADATQYVPIYGVAYWGSILGNIEDQTDLINKLNGIKIDDLYNVDIVNLTDNQLLRYNSTTENWENVDFDLSDYYTKSETDNLLDGKVDNSDLDNYYTSGQTDNLLDGKVDNSDLDNYYTSGQTDNLLSIDASASITVGGIAAGDNYTDKTAEEMFDLLLNPVLYPTLSNPYHNLSITSPTDNIAEIGTLYDTITLRSTFDRGSISPDYGTSGYRSGLPINFNFSGIGVTPSIPSTDLIVSTNISNYTIISGWNTWNSTVDYDEGEQPLDSKGNNYLTSLDAGTTVNMYDRIYGTMPWFGTTSDITTLTKQSLQYMTSTTPDTITFVAENGGNKQTADFANIWQGGDVITSIEFFDTSSNTWKEIWNLTNLNNTFIVTDTTHVVQGQTINYKRYTNATSGNLGERKLRFS